MLSLMQLKKQDNSMVQKSNLREVIKMRETINNIFKEMESNIESDSWKERTEKYFKVNYIPKGFRYALVRDIATKDISAHGMNIQEIKQMLKGASKQSSAYLVEVKIKRVV
jgi:hypothetical protein